MRLIDHLAAERRVYRGALPTLPDILLIDIPPAYASFSLPMGRYYPVVVETDAEMREMDAFLRMARATPVAPALLDRRPSFLRSPDILFARYRPVEPGWPWILLCCWPPSITGLASVAADQFARQAYTIEVFAIEADLHSYEQALLAKLGPQEIRRIHPQDDPGGHA